MKISVWIKTALVFTVAALFALLFFILNQELKHRVDEPIFGKFYSKKETPIAFEMNKKITLKWGTHRMFEKYKSRAFLQLEKGNLYKSMINFHRAKMVIPDDFETRINLADVFTRMCLKEGKYCGNSQREIKNALKFTRNIEKKNLKEKDIKKLFALQKAMKLYACQYFQKPCK